MTPPDTDLQKQKRRHRGPLIGMALVVAIGVGVILYWIAEEAFMAPGPDEAETEMPTPGDVMVDEPQPEPTVE